MLEDVLEVAQLLACENLEEIENFLREQGYVSNDFATIPQMTDGLKRHLNLDDISQFLMTRADLGLT